MVANFYEKITRASYSFFFLNVLTEKELLETIQSCLTSSKTSVKTFSYMYIGSFYFMVTDPEYLRSLQAFNYVYLDGFFPGWIVRILTGRKIDVINLQYLNTVLAFCEQKKKKVFLLGSDKSTYQKAIQNTKKTYPNLYIEGNHGFFNIDKKVLNKIQTFAPDVIFVSLGLSTQEKWISRNMSSLQSVPVIICTGIYVDILGGKNTFPKNIYHKYNVKWLVRLIKEPRRLWKRYFFGFSIFLLLSHYFLYKHFLNLFEKKKKSI